MMPRRSELARERFKSQMIYYGSPAGFVCGQGCSYGLLIGDTPPQMKTKQHAAVGLLTKSSTVIRVVFHQMEDGMGKAIVVYATNNGSTKSIADLIAEGIRLAGHEATVVDVKVIKKEADLQDYDAHVFGSATYHGEMMQGMKTMLFLAQKAGLKGKAGGAFGAFGWSGEAPTRIFDTMKHVLEMDMVGSPLALKSVYLEGGTQMAQDYGRELAKKL